MELNKIVCPECKSQEIKERFFMRQKIMGAVKSLNIIVVK